MATLEQGLLTLDPGGETVFVGREANAIVGSDADDVVTTTSAAQLFAGGGDDVLRVLGATSFEVGGNGAPVIVRPTIAGDAGADTIELIDFDPAAESVAIFAASDAGSDDGAADSIRVGPAAVSRDGTRITVYATPGEDTVLIEEAEPGGRTIVTNAGQGSITITFASGGAEVRLFSTTPGVQLDFATDVSIVSVAEPAPGIGGSDFAGTGTDDVLWFLEATGRVGRHEMSIDGGQWDFVGTAGAGWTVAGTGDVNGDGIGDIVWNGPGNAFGAFVMDEAGTPTWTPYGTAGAAWQVAAIADIDGDGADDVVWFREDVNAISWHDIDGDVASWSFIATNGGDWRIAGAGDFDGDGTDDLLYFSEAAGAIGQQRMDGAVPTWRGITGVGEGWSVVGVGDFNGDTIDDILWQNDQSGQIGQHRMVNGVAEWRGVGNPGQNWEVGGVGDYDGDGVDDVLFFNPGTDQFGYWKMDHDAFQWIAAGTAAGDWVLPETGLDMI